MNEREILEQIARLFPARRAAVGIGDDAAVVRLDGERVITSDMLIEGSDFTRDSPLELIAKKSLRVNLSDVAAMGCLPELFMLDLGIPEWAEDSLGQFLESLSEDARSFDVELIGGDLSTAERLTIAITVIGRPVDGCTPLLRKGAREGDRIFLSRPIGGSHAGLKLLEAGWRVDGEGRVSPPSGQFSYAQRELAETALRLHVLPEPEVELGVRLAETYVSSCIDVSDGLSTDLHHLCRASRCGAVLEWERIPILPDLATVGRSLGIDPEFAAVNGGEEFSLVFTCTETEAVMSARLGRPVYSIGRIVAGSGVELSRGGKRTELAAKGFDHFER